MRQEMRQIRRRGAVERIAAQGSANAKRLRAAMRRPWRCWQLRWVTDYSSELIVLQITAVPTRKRQQIGQVPQPPNE